MSPVRSKKSTISAENVSRTSNGIAYTIKKHKRAKYVRLSVYPDGRVVLTLPYWVAKYKGKHYIEEKREWILKQIEAQKEKNKDRHVFTRADYVKHKETARKLITERVEYFNQFYNFSYKRISVKDAKTMWGSCSAKKNLNFNYKLLFLSPEQRDYVIVHELCHLKELNHSRRFWDLVRQQVPDMEKIKRELRSKNIF